MMPHDGGVPLRKQERHLDSSKAGGMMQNGRER